LGYYTRARNLHITAKAIANEYGGVFPRKYDELLKLKGVGEYTAAAIASIAFKEPVALVDGNVYRVLSRLFAVYTPVNTAAGKTVFFKLATEILNPKKPDIHNQALMEFGALVCLPRNPMCDLCVLAKDCKAKTGGLVDVLPVKEGKRRVRTRYFHYLVLRHNDKTYINRRNNKDIWNSLFEFPLIETEIREDFHELAASPPWNSLLKNSSFELQGKPKTYKHQLTHQTLYCSFYLVNIPKEPVKTDQDFFPVAFKQLDGFAVPKVIDRYIGDLKDEGIV
jgi:A/G-specific adenine glycosylase